MPPWNLSAGDPLSLNLAADSRLVTTDYTDDQIWELSLGGGEPAALALETTYGLRAQRLRIFPRFIQGDTQYSDPAGFYTPPNIISFAPNYLELTFTPFEGLEVVAEYWVPESQVVGGRFSLINQSVLPLSFRLELAALLVPRDRQGSLAPFPLGASQALVGETTNLQPALFLTGGPQAAAGPYPALAVDLEMYPGNLRMYTWSMAGMREQQQSLDAARRTTGRSWDAEVTRLALLNQSQTIQISTGNREWDIAFALSQKSALELFLHNRLNLPHPSVVLTRRPDQGYSVRGDGADHPLPWSGQTALDTYYLASLLPGAPELIAGVLRNFLTTQDDDGRIDWRPGLGGQRTRRLAHPLLASLAVQLAPQLQNPLEVVNGEEPDPTANCAQNCWYEEVYPGLLRFYQAWFATERDADGDGIPEWENSIQTGLEEAPVFERFSPEARGGADASRVESPALMAMLYRECASLMTLARTLGKTEDLPILQESQARLAAALEECWDPAAGLYRYRDYATHLSLPGMSVVTFQGNGEFESKRRFKQPRRLVLRLDAFEERTYAAIFTIFGYTLDGEVSESIQPRNLAWLSTQAHAMTQHTYLAIDRIEVQGLGPRDRVRIFAPDLNQEDCSLLLPLWAGAANPERAQQMVESTLLPRFRQEYGIAVAPGQVDTVSLPWNHLLGEGLVRYDYRSEAANLVERMMNAIVPTLQQQRAFRQTYHAGSGQPGGERGHLHGLAPLGLFLQALGIRRMTDQQILLDGFNPLTAPITVQYRRVKLVCYPERTEITFAGGQRITVDQPGPQQILLE